MGGEARLKQVNNRKSRPSWVMSDKQMMLRCVDTRHLLRFKIAEMYWRKNMTAKDIALVLDLSLEAVKHIVRRLGKKK